MTLIILSEIIEINNKIDKEIEFYEQQLHKTEFRLDVLREERRQLVELLGILAEERNKDGQKTNNVYRQSN